MEHRAPEVRTRLGIGVLMRPPLEFGRQSHCVSLPFRRWDAALAASAADPHVLHEAKAQVGNGRREEAVGRRRGCTARLQDPMRLPPLFAQVLMEAGEDFKAVQSAQRAVELRPGWADAHLTLSRAQVRARPGAACSRLLPPCAAGAGRSGHLRGLSLNLHFWFATTQIPPCPAPQLNIGEPELALQSMERVLQLQPGHPEAAAEIVSIQTVVLQRRASGVAAGQRARVVPSGGGGAP